MIEPRTLPNATWSRNFNDTGEIGILKVKVSWFLKLPKAALDQAKAQLSKPKWFWVNLREIIGGAGVKHYLIEDIGVTKFRGQRTREGVTGA